MTTNAKKISLLEPSILVPAIGDSFRKLDPRTLARNPVMFAVEIVAAAATLLFLRDLLESLEWLDDLDAPMPHEEQPSSFHH